TSEPAIARALRHEGWHGSRCTPEQAAPFVTRLRAARPEADFAISLRYGWNGRALGEPRGRPEGYAAAGGGPALIEPAEGEFSDWRAAVARVGRAAEGIAK